MSTGTRSDSPSDPFRVFVSYSHTQEDIPRFEKLKKALEDLDLCVLSDRDIGPGTPFTDEIKGLITHAHLFIPLITSEAQAPWVHQETGFAMARNIPILPIVLEKVEMPSEMIAQVQAIKVDEELSNVGNKLKESLIQDLVLPKPGPPIEMVQIAEWPEQRALWLAEWSRRVIDVMKVNSTQTPAAKLRQRGAFSSFCIPDDDITSKAFLEHEGKCPRSEYYRTLLRRERQALEWHAKNAGCRLIVDPALRLKHRDLEQTLARLKTLRKFLESSEDSKVEIVLSPAARGDSLTIVGNWFVADSMVPRPGGYRQTIFNWHAPTVSRYVQRFDEQFDYLFGLQKQKENYPKSGSSLQYAINEVKKIISDREEELKKTQIQTPKIQPLSEPKSSEAR